MSNKYDQLEVNISKLHKDLDSKLIPCSTRYTRFGLKEKIVNRLGMWESLIDSGFERRWFEEFSEFWINCLHARPLKLHDFFFLHSHYRTRFQSLEVKEQSSDSEFLEAWQDHRNIFMIFSAVYRYALNPSWHKNFTRWIGDKKNGEILDYGSGYGQIAQSMLTDNLTGYKFTLADIENFTFAYSKYRLQQFSNVKFVNITPFKDPDIGENKYDLVFLLTVLEHLPDPMSVIQNIERSMKKGGYLIFDFILSEGTGLDTVESIKARREILDFISTKFQVLEGELQYDKSMGQTVIIKI